MFRSCLVTLVVFLFYSRSKLNINVALRSTGKPIKMSDLLVRGNCNSVVSQYFCDVHSSQEVGKLVSGTLALGGNSKRTKCGTVGDFATKVFWIETVCMHSMGMYIQ